MSYARTEVYSPWKVCHHQDRLKALREGKKIAPTQVQVDLTNACCHDCLYCFFRGILANNKSLGLNELFNEKDTIPTKRMLELLEEFKKFGVNAVPYTGGGEPLLHPDYLKILKRTLELELETSLITNGSLLNKKIIEELRHPLVKWIRVSLDSSNETNWKILQRPKVNVSFNQILDKIRALVENKHKEQVIGLSFVINPYNWHEVLDFVKLGKSLGVDNVRISLTYTALKDELHKPYWDKVLDLIAKAKAMETKDFRIFSMQERFHDLERKEKTYDYCWFHHFSTALGADLKLYYCCAVKYAKNFVIGDLSKDSFEEVWFKKKVPPNVRICPNCWFDRPNEFIEYLLLKNPPHVNFI